MGNNRPNSNKSTLPTKHAAMETPPKLAQLLTALPYLSLCAGTLPARGTKCIGADTVPLLSVCSSHGTTTTPEGGTGDSSCPSAQHFHPLHVSTSSLISQRTATMEFSLANLALNHPSGSCSDSQFAYFESLVDPHSLLLPSVQTASPPLLLNH